MKRNDMHREVINHFGATAQIKKTMEELLELWNELHAYSKDKLDKKELISEFADVLNMCEQLKIIGEIENVFTVEEVEKMQNKKMMRTLEIAKR